MHLQLKTWLMCAGEPLYCLLRMVKAHARIVWSVSWAPGGRVFATGSRDNSVKLWSNSAEGALPMHLRLVVSQAWS